MGRTRRTRHRQVTVTAGTRLVPPISFRARLSDIDPGGSLLYTSYNLFASADFRLRIFAARHRRVPIVGEIKRRLLFLASFTDSDVFFVRQGSEIKQTRFDTGPKHGPLIASRISRHGADWIMSLGGGAADRATLFNQFQPRRTDYLLTVFFRMM
jgi:hypothetical protein